MSSYRSPLHRNSVGFTIIELLVVIAILTILAAIILPALSRSRAAARRASCANNLKQMSLALAMYAQEDKIGQYPPLMKFSSNSFDPVTKKTLYAGSCVLSNPVADGDPVNGTFDWSLMFPQYIDSPELNLCPSDLGFNKVSGTGA